MRALFGDAAILALAMAIAPHSAFAATEAAGADPTLSPLLVTGATPLSDPAAGTVGAGQSATAAQIEHSNVVDLSAFLNRSFDGVYVNDIQNNPLQPDINYRGYTASPLLGTPEGLSLYMDGVRLNQPFGDVVSWDLIPRIAISSVSLAEGSNPLFGLNSLGGAISVRTKDGKNDPGLGLQGSYGAYHRWTGDGEIGGKIAENLYGYFSASVFSDKGWRPFSPSDAHQFFGKLSWIPDEGTQVDLTGSYAESNLFGNGLQDIQLLNRDYSSVYTVPDTTQNNAGLVNLSVRHKFSDTLSFSGNLYGRQIRTLTANGDVNDDSVGESVFQPSAAEQTALRNAGFTGFPTAGESAGNTPFPKWRCIANALLNSEPNEKCDGALNTSRTFQEEYGGSAQLVLTAPLGAMANRFTFGGGYIASHVHFNSATQFGYLNPDRTITTVSGPGAFADGSQNSENAFDARVDLVGSTRTTSVYASDTLSLMPTVDLTVSGRYDHVTVHNLDRIDPKAGSGSLTGDHSFDNVNPAVNLTWSPTKTFAAYASFTQASRAPSAIELGCSDPDNECRLPNAMAGDPPLKAVRAQTFEIGLRGRFADIVSWRASAFRSENHQDILFVSDSASGYGYFRNFGGTRRQGIELGLNAQYKRLRFDASYTYLDATFQSPETLLGEGNSANDVGPGFEGDITVKPGDRLPLIPQSVFKAAIEYELVENFTLGIDARAQSGVYARGDENNLHKPDGVYYIGKGMAPGFVVFDLNAEYKLAKSFALYVAVDNLLDHRYYSSAQLGSTAITPAGTVNPRPFAGPVIGDDRPVTGSTFYAPGAPRIIRVGFRFKMN